MPQTDITCKYLGQNKKNAKFGYIVSSEGDTYGCATTQLSQFTTGQIYTIKFHVNEKGYKEFDAIVSSQNPVKQNVRQATHPADSDRMATMGMVNNFIACGQVAKDPDSIASIINTCHEGLMRSVIKGKQVQRRDDLDDSIPY